MSTKERLVVPTQGHVDRLAREGARAETREALRGRLLAALAPEIALSTRLEARIALARATKDAADRSLASLSSRAWPRMVDALEDALDELRAAGVDADDLDEVAGRAPLLGAVMRGMDARLARAGLFDGRRAPSMLARVLSRAEPDAVRAAAGAPRFVAEHVASWPAAEIAWWRALDAQLSRTGGAAVVRALATVRPLDAAREASPLDRVLDALAQALDEAPETRAARAPLGDMRMEGKLAGGVRVEVRRASDAAAQARAVAHAVRAAIEGGAGETGQLALFGAAKGGAAIDAVAIGVPGIDDETLGPVRRALEELGVPVREPHAPAPSRSPAVATALAALALGARGLPRLEVAALLRSPYVDVEDRHALADALEQKPSPRAEDAAGSLERAAAGAGAVGRALAEASQARSREEHVRAARRIFAALGMDRRAPAGAGRIFGSAAKDELFAFARDARAWRALGLALDAQDAAAARLGLSGDELTGDAFRHELVRALDEEAPTPPAASAGAVRLATLDELAGEPLDLLVILDANDGVLPEPAGGAGLLDAELRAALRAKDPLRAPPSAAAREDAALLSVALAVENARAIVVCHRERDASGAALAPSPLAAWLERAGAETSRWTAAPLSTPATSPHDGRLFAAAREGRRGTSDAARRARIERAREAFFEVDNPEAAAVVGNLGDVSAALEQALTESTGGGARAMSVTALERIATCAFQGFAQQVLRADARRPVAELPDAREGGTLLHGALAAAFAATAALWRERPRDRARIEAEALRAADAVLERDSHASGLRRLALDRYREHVQAVVGWSLDDEAWDFAFAERGFGAAMDWGPLVLDDGTTKIALRGSIDRVDRAHAGGAGAAVRVIDYKSSDGGAQRATKGLGDATLQIALYARVAAAALGAREASGLYLPAHAAVLPLSARRLESSARAWAKAHEDVEGVERAVATALDVVRALRSGAVAPGPLEKDACERCAFDGGCRKPRFVIRGQSEDVPDAS